MLGITSPKYHELIVIKKIDNNRVINYTPKKSILLPSENSGKQDKVKFPKKL